MIETLTQQIVPRTNEGIASRMLLLVKRQILPHTDSVWDWVHLYTYLNPRYICVTRPASAVARGVNVCGHTATLGTIRTELKRTGRFHNYTPARAAGLS